MYLVDIVSGVYEKLIARPESYILKNNTVREGITRIEAHDVEAIVN